MSGPLSADTSWTPAGSPYYVTNNILIPDTVTLTIEAGTVVKFAQSNRTNNIYPGLVVQSGGTLTVIGTPSEPVYLTDYRDDTVPLPGEDTNGDGAATSPAAAWWGGININDGGSATLDYVHLRYAGNNIAYYTSGSGILVSGSGSLAMIGSTISNTGGRGVYLSDVTGTAVIDTSTLSDNTLHGIESRNSTPSVTGNTITGNNQYGIYVTGPAVPVSIAANTVSGNTNGSMMLTANATGTAIAGDNAITGPIVIGGGTIDASAAWNSPFTYYVTNNILIPDTVTLTIGAGTVVKFAQSNRSNAIYPGLVVQSGGTLTVNGAPEDPVYLTDYRDDTTPDGDTNGDGSVTTPAPGWWGGINIKAGGSVSLSWTQLRYAGNYTESSSSGIGILVSGSGSLAMTGSTISNTGGRGVYLIDVTGTATIDTSTISGSSNDGILIQSSAGTVSIENSTLTGNAQSGLRVESSTPSITGNIITDNTQYGIYLSGAATTPDIFSNTISGNATGIHCQDNANPLVGGAAENRNNIYDNSVYGLNNLSSGVTINATHNWWGAYSGPYHEGDDPPGEGDTVSDYIDFGDYLQLSFLTGDLNNDNAVDLVDLIVGLEIVTGSQSTEFNTDFALRGIDVGGDDRVGPADLLYIVQKVAGLR